MSRPAILFLPEFFPTDLEYSAFAERCRAMAEKIGRSGFDVRVLVLRRTDVRQAIITSDAYAVQARADWASKFLFANLPSNMLQRAVAFLEILRVARAVRPRVIVISAHDPMLYLAALSVGSILGIPVVTDAHDSRLVMGAIKRPHPSRFIKLHLERNAMRWAHRIWVPTTSLADLLGREYGIPRERFRVVGNGVSIRRVAAVTRHPAGSRELLHLGGPRAYYDSPVLIEAIQRARQVVPDLSLTFLGIRDDSYTAGIRRLVEAKGLSDAIRFLSPVPLEAVPGFMERAIAGIHTYALHPVYATTVGLKVMEYMAVGLPVVHRGPRDGETWKIVEGNGVGLCWETTSDLARAIVEIAQSDELRERMAERAREAVVRYD